MKRDDQLIRLPRASARNAPQTRNRKRLLAEITSKQMGLCSRDYRRHLAICEEYGAEPINFVIFTIEWLEVCAKTDKTPVGEWPAEDCQSRNYDAMYYGKKGFE